ncbi:putative dehydrogenase [Gracilibacillus halotolerans]|uniref:Putative dehydrogenase n=1 Tax=Gracilibacillus halotolerans TaxID=74386 RepID=A0A841RGP5_9BACI|nr:Gfo/Idh/MocA family oxidoreductase [Gracilibacillus halotolerans]MBB6513310.1 putative dehydrogenase [Gracilibacillus halotolerans]
MKTIKTSVIGSGFSATSHIEALKRIPNVQVIAVVSRSLERAEKLAKQHAIKYAYDDVTDLLNNKEIEVVHNCTPNSLHYSLNKQILESGKHVLSEKPLALDSNESSELANLAKEKNLVNGVCFNYRHYPLIKESKTKIANNDYGKPHLVSGGYIQDWCLYPSDYSWRMDSTLNGPSRAIADIGSHWCDTIQNILGKRIVRVFADLTTVHNKRQKPFNEASTFSNNSHEQYQEVHIDTEDAGHVLIQFEDGVKGMFNVSQVSAGRKNNFHFAISMADGTLSWDQEKPNELWIGKRNQANELLVKDPDLLTSEARSLAHYPGGHQEGWPDGLKNLFIDFYDHVRNPKSSEQHDYSTFEDAHYIMKIVDAILKSNELERWIEIE